jgi:hypothetical protein
VYEKIGAYIDAPLYMSTEQIIGTSVYEKMELIWTPECICLQNQV